MNDVKKVLVIGLGVSGKASADLLLSKGFSVTAADRRYASLQADPTVASFIERGLTLSSDDDSCSLSSFAFAVLSPGIDPTHPLIKKIKEANLPTVGEIELAFRYLPNRKILGVTGSNGKTTTVLLTAHILNTAGRKARALGNVGAALSGYAACKPEPDEILVVELSSFQLESLTIAPYFDAAAILNITPNHLNRHSSMEEYAGAKLRIGSCLKPEGKLFISKQVQNGYRVEGAEIFDLGGPTRGSDDVRLGKPEWINIAAALSLARFCGVDDEEVARALETFRKPAHRIEWVAEIDGVAYYNDSKASNVEAVTHAVKLFSTPIVLIAGGVDKGSSYRPWIDPFRGKVKRIVVYGEAAEKMERELGSDFLLDRTQTLREALGLAAAAAQSGDVILFSPGCSSYDQFANYEERGDAFKKMVGERGWIEKRS